MIEQGIYGRPTEAHRKDASACEAPSYGHGVILLAVLTRLAYRKRLIAKVTGIAVLSGVVLSLLLPVRYTAGTKTMAPHQTQSSATMFMNQLANSGAGSLAAIAGGGLGLKNPNDVYIGLLKSRPVADAIIRRFNLTTVYHAKDMTVAREKLAANTLVVSENNGFLSLSVTDKDRKRVAEIANAYTDELRNITKKLAITEASQRRLFYEEQLKQAKESLISAELSFQEIQQRKGLVQLDAQARAMIEGLAVLRAQRAAKEVELQAMRSYSTDNNPEVQLAERELSSLREEAGRLEQRNHSSGPADLALGDVPGAGLEYLRAEHELKYRQTMSDLLVKQYDAATLDGAKDATVIQVVETAIPPDRRSSPHRASIVLLCAIIGFIGACLYLYLAHLAQRNPEIPQALAELKVALIGR
jgi:tyrosine-protein kinase Etk/Wzc